MLVIDDFHLVKGSQIGSLLILIAKEQPENLHIAVVTCDTTNLDSWAADGAKYMSKLGIIKGDARGYFMPKATTTAQQAAGYGTATREAAVLMSVRTYEVQPR